VGAFTPIPKVTATNFIDVSASFWARSAIERASHGGFLSGLPELKFCPNQNLTKSEAILSLVNGLELKAGNPDSLKVYSDRSVIRNFALSAIATATDLNIRPLAKIAGTSSGAHPTREKTFCGMGPRARPKMCLKGLLQEVYCDKLSGARSAIAAAGHYPR